jgi:hypothetical protein
MQTQSTSRPPGPPSLPCPSDRTSPSGQNNSRDGQMRNLKSETRPATRASPTQTARATCVLRTRPATLERARWCAEMASSTRARPATTATSSMVTAATRHARSRPGQFVRACRPYAACQRQPHCRLARQRQPHRRLGPQYQRQDRPPNHRATRSPLWLTSRSGLPALSPGNTQQRGWGTKV